MKNILILLIIAVCRNPGSAQNEIVIEDDGGATMTLKSNLIQVDRQGTLFLNPTGGNVQISNRLGISMASPLTRLHIGGNDDASLTTHGLMMLGSRTSTNIIFDADEIMARNNNSPSTLSMNREGGNVEFFEAGTGSFIVHGLTLGDYANMQYNTSNKRFYYDGSSRRYKENITDLHDDWTKILQVRPVTYTRPGDPERWEYGYIAEEIDSIGLSNMVGYDANGIPDDVRYDKMILYLTEMIKLQQEQIGKLEKKISQIESSSSFSSPSADQRKKIIRNKKARTTEKKMEEDKIAGTEVQTHQIPDPCIFL